MNLGVAISSLHDTIVEGFSRSVAVPAPASDLRVMIAWERAEWEAAFRLVASSYQAAGYESTDAGAVRFTPFHALPDTVTFVAKRKDRVVMTFALVADNSILGLPMETIYPEEIANLRGEGRRLGEVISFAAEDLNLREFAVTFRALIRLMKQYHVSQGGDTWVITVNPKHRQFYTKVLGYIPLGPCKPYYRVQGAPAEAFVLDAAMMQEHAPKVFDEMFAEPLPRSVLTAAKMPPVLTRYFAGMSNRSFDKGLLNVLRAVDEERWVRQWPKVEPRKAKSREQTKPRVQERELQPA